MSRKKSFSIRFTVFSSFFAVVNIVVLVLLGLQYYFSIELAKAATSDQFEVLTRLLKQETRSMDDAMSSFIRLAEPFPGLKTHPTSKNEHPALRYLANSMKSSDRFYAVYLGFQDGAFYEIINLESELTLRHHYKAPPEAQWLINQIQSSDGRKREKEIFYLDKAFTNIHTKIESTDYQPNLRPWFQGAMKQESVYKTQPYIFSNLKEPGITYSKNLGDGVVMAVDITLKKLSHFLGRQKPWPESEIFIFNPDGDLSCFSLPKKDKAKEQVQHQEEVFDISLTPEEQSFIKSLGTIRVSNEMDWPPFDYAVGGAPQGYSIDLLSLLSQRTGVELEYINGYTWGELYDLYLDGKIDVLHSLYKSEKRKKEGLFTEPYLNNVATLVTRSGEHDSFRKEKGFMNKVLALPKGWAAEDTLKKLGAKILYKEDLRACLQAVASGEAEGVVCNAYVARYLIKRNFIEGLEPNVAPDVFNATTSSNLHIMIRQDWPLLQSIFSKGLASLTTEDIKKLRVKWLGEDLGGKGTQSGHLINNGSVSHESFLNHANDLENGYRLNQYETDAGVILGFAASLGKDETVKLGFSVPEKVVMEPYLHQVTTSIWVALIMLMFSYPLPYLVAKMITKPILKITDTINELQGMKLNTKIQADSAILEIHEAQKALGSLSNGLRSFKRYMPSDLVHQLIEKGLDAKVGGEEKRLVILFSDIANFTTISESTPPTELMKHLGEYFEELSRIIIVHEGTIDKFIGDAIMAFWGAPLDVEDPVSKALETAFLMQKKLDELNAKWDSEGLPVLETRIGLHVGTTLVGNVGSYERLNYTILGDSVNVAARLEGANKDYGTKVLMSQDIWEEAPDHYSFEFVDEVKLKGKMNSTKVYTFKDMKRF